MKIRVCTTIAQCVEVEIRMRIVYVHCWSTKDVKDSKNVLDTIQIPFRIAENSAECMGSILIYLQEQETSIERDTIFGLNHPQNKPIEYFQSITETIRHCCEKRVWNLNYFQRIWAFVSFHETRNIRVLFSSHRPLAPVFQTLLTFT